ncbi:MAG: L,D-transpeptidase family protein [Pseudomonadota bacterium]
MFGCDGSICTGTNGDAWMPAFFLSPIGIPLIMMFIYRTFRGSSEEYINYTPYNNMILIGNNIIFRGKTYHCAIGKNGFSADKKEGDGCTPLGTFPLRELWYRADKIKKPRTDLPLKIITQNDGWCDDVNSPDYNRHILLPSSFSHEKLWRDDDVYDLIIPIGYNDSSVVSGKGSAIFIHIARENYEPTEGCVALKLADLLEILPFLSTKTLIEIKL